MTVLPVNLTIIESTASGEGSGGSGSGAGTISIYQYAGDPNGVVTAAPPALCLDTLNHIQWWKTDGVTSNTGWY